MLHYRPVPSSLAEDTMWAKGTTGCASSPTSVLKFVGDLASSSVCMCSLGPADDAGGNQTRGEGTAHTHQYRASRRAAKPWFDVLAIPHATRKSGGRA